MQADWQTRQADQENHHTIPGWTAESLHALDLDTPPLHVTPLGIDSALVLPEPAGVVRVLVLSRLSSLVSPLPLLSLPCLSP